MAQAPTLITNNLRIYGIGIISGSLIMIFFSLAWLGMASNGIPDNRQMIYWGTIYVFCIVPLIVSILLLIKLSRLPWDSSKESVMEGNKVGKKIGISFGIIFGLEFILAGVAAILFSKLHHMEYFIPVLSIIVGVHFLPLAHIFKTWIYYVTAILLILSGILVMLATSSASIIQGTSIWNILPGLFDGPVLLLTAIGDIIIGWKKYKQLVHLLK